MSYASAEMPMMRHARFRYLRGGLGLGLATLSSWTAFGTLGYMVIEGWSFIDSLYMSVLTISTVGFGEVNPLSPAGRLFATLLIVVGLATAMFTLTRLGQVVLEGELVGGLGRRRMLKELSKLDNHFIVCGFGRAARPVAEVFAHKGIPFCVIESNPAAENDLRDVGYPYLIDNATEDEALHLTGIERASCIVTLLPSDADNLYVTVTAKALNPNVRVIARSSDDNGATKLRRAGANEVVSLYSLASHRIVQAATSPNVLKFMDHVSDGHHMEVSFIEAQVGERSDLAGSTIEDAKTLTDLNVRIVAMKRGDERMRFNPRPEEQLESGDVLVLMGHDDDLQEAEAKLGV